MIENVYVAGGIGSGINMGNAIEYRYVPGYPCGDVPLSWKLLHWPVHTQCCIPTEAERKVYEIAQNMTYIELSNVPTYMDEFVAACFVPHTDKSLFPSIQ